MPICQLSFLIGILAYFIIGTLFFVISLQPMKYYLYILLFLIGTAASAHAQGRSGSRGGRGGFSLSNLSSSNKEIPDSLLQTDSAALKSKRIIGYRLTPLLGERYIAPMDTNRLNFGNSTLVEANSLAVGYLANVGSPAQTRIFNERKEERDFIFADAYDYYITTPTNAYFYDTKVPYTQVTYTTGGASQNKMDRLKGVLTMNFGKKINVGGEMDYIGRGMLDPAFANVAFNLTDPKKISKIVESEFGYHIIQLIDKRGDKIKCRHILLKPQVSQDAIDKSIGRLDSIGNDIRAAKFTFEQAVEALSDDKDTRNNKGLMANVTPDQSRTSRFQMKDLPTEVARTVDTMKVGEVSAPFTMVNSKGKTTCALVKLVSRVDGHRATITEDFQVMKDVVLAKERAQTLHDWVVNKIKQTYVRMNDRYKDCKFEYQGWIK